MKSLAWGLLLFHGLIVLLWIANSAYLFSPLGVTIWLISIAFGFIVHKKMEDSSFIKKLLFASCFFMVFLAIITIVIHITINAMP